jgi:hypothetical protein
MMMMMMMMIMTISPDKASASVKEKRTQLSLTRKAELCTRILLAAHREGGHTFTKTMKAWYKYRDWIHPTNNDRRLVGKHTEAILSTSYMTFHVSSPKPNLRSSSELPSTTII